MKIMKYWSSKKKVKFLIILEIKMKVIIGIQIFKKWKIKINSKEENISIKKKNFL
jgi:hypothetical protein